MLTVRILAVPAGAAGLVVPVPEGRVPEAWRAQAAADGFTGAPDSLCEGFTAHGRLVLVDLGDDPEGAGARAVSRLLRCGRVEIDARGLPAVAAARLAAGACLRAWRYERLRTRTDEDAPLLTELDLVSDDPATPACWEELAAGVEGALFARDLVTEPSDTLTPSGFVDRLAVLRDAGVTLEVFGPDELAAMGAGGLLAVGRGSAHPPRLAVLRWPGQGGAPVALVGKGITFDTGGISIKPAEDMWEMRADMAGAAACAGAMLALARRRSAASAVAVLALAENATGAASYRPGDVLRMLSGMTVQVVDTDAEGRLVLADALAYAARLSPCSVIDLATLTGSIVSALGHERAGAFGEDAGLIGAVSDAGDAVGERVWRMPVDEGHRRALDSDIADIRHCVDERGQPDASQAAAFLREFVGEAPWVHLDIAGVESRAEVADAHAKGATGFGARLLDRLVAARFEA